MHIRGYPSTKPGQLQFTAETAPRMSALLERLRDPERLAEVGDWIIECETEEELLARVQGAIP